ncbi:MAG: glycogen-binding domain-containing protein [Gemmatimonadaceae bacterium]
MFAPTSARTQQSNSSTRGVTVETDYGTVTIDGYAPATLTNMLGSAWSATPRLDVGVSASGARFETSHIAGYGALRATLHTALSTDDVLDLTTDSGIGAYRGAASGAYTLASLRLVHGVGHRTSFWIATGLGAAGNNGAYSTARAAVGASLITGDAAATLSLDVAHAASAMYSDLRVSAAWQLPHAGAAAVPSRIGVDLEGGVRGGDLAGRSAWADVGIHVRLIGPSFLVITNGITAPDPERAIPGSRFTTAGLRLTFGGARPAPSLPPLPIIDASAAMVSEPLRDGTRTLTLHVAGAHSVDVMGDFTTWLSMPLHQAAPGSWAARCVLRPGTHRLNMRVDGGPWRVVEGLPATGDDFGGEVSVLIVR